ncbi:hypothetical protein BASA81_006321 [Batrachochytrium salamandrivorans]|nr:hypothetical protein BASA81_006321 [Batrachochytrium salamandrivorans]
MSEHVTSEGENDELDDFDFKSMLNSMDPGVGGNGSFFQIPMSNNSSGYFPSNILGAIAVPSPPTQAGQLPLHQVGTMPHRLSRSNSGNVISTRLRCASDMHQMGLLNNEEKSYMKDLILSRNPRFKDEFTVAERTNNWQYLSQYLRNSKRVDSNMNNNVLDSLVSEFDTLSGGGGGLPGGGGGIEEDRSAAKKRAAAGSFGRPKKSVVPEMPTSPPPARPVVPPFLVSVPSSSSSTNKEDCGEYGVALDEQANKTKKNERERKRRLAVSNGFDELFVLLKLPQSSKIDKVSILRKAVDRIQELEEIVRSNGMVVPPTSFSTQTAGGDEDEDDDE